MDVSVYTTDPVLKRRFCREARKSSNSWKQIRGMMWLNDAAILLFSVIAIYAMVVKPTTFLLVGAITVLLAVFSAFLHNFANSDVKELFSKRLDETVVYLENGDLIYTYRTENRDRKTLSTVVLKMTRNDIREAIYIQTPNMSVFSGRFTKKITSEGNIVEELVDAIGRNDNGDLDGTIFCPCYIILNQSMTRLLQQMTG